MYNVTNFIPERALRATMKSQSTGQTWWTLTQIENPKLNCDGTEIIKNDATGTPIISVDSAKTAEFSAANSLLDLNLMANQFGTTKKIASETDKIVSPAVPEVFTIKTEETTAVLKNIPYGTAGAEIKFIYSLKSDGSLDKEFKLGDTASETDFTLDASTKTITLPTGLDVGTQVLVDYEYETSEAVSVDNTATNFPTAGKLVVTYLGYDVCDKSTKIVAHQVFPNAKLTTAVDMDWTTEGTHPFTIKCMQDYCDPLKKLFTIVIPKE